MRISVHSLLRAWIGGAALLLAACRGTRDPGCAPDGTGETGGKGGPGIARARASQPRAYPGQEPKPARFLSETGGWRIGARGAKFLPEGAAEAEPQAQEPEAVYAGGNPAPAGEFLTWPPVDSWPAPGAAAASSQPRAKRRPVRTDQAARSAPKRRSPHSPAPASAKPGSGQTEIAKAPPPAKPAAARPAAPPRTAKPAPARPQKLTDIPRPGQNTAPEDALEKLRRRAEKSLSGN